MRDLVQSMYDQCRDEAIRQAGGELVTADDGDVIFDADDWEPTDADEEWVLSQLAPAVHEAYNHATGEWIDLDWAITLRTDSGEVVVVADKDDAQRYGVSDEYSAYADTVREDATRAQSLGDSAIAAFEAGDIEAAITASDEATIIERQYGDAPVWSPLAEALYDYSDAIQRL
jgi:hypothetical protein